MGNLLLLRHGETEWTIAHQHTGRTDIPLTARGEDQARELRAAVEGREFVGVWSSPLQRARRTAELAGLCPQLDTDLLEWDYGLYEGRRTAEIETARPGWNLWTDGAEGGESPNRWALGSMRFSVGYARYSTKATRWWWHMVTYSGYWRPATLACQ